MLGDVINDQPGPTCGTCGSSGLDALAGEVVSCSGLANSVKTVSSTPAQQKPKANNKRVTRNADCFDPKRFFTKNDANLLSWLPDCLAASI